MPEIANPFEFVANCIGLLVLVSATVFELLINPRRYRRAMAAAQNVDERLEAVRNRNRRTEIAVGIAFVPLAFSYLLSLFDAIK